MTSNNNLPKRQPILGCIADDVTGATDLALNLVQGGACVAQVLGVPTKEELATISADAIVIALKTRSIPPEDAKSQTLRALQSLQEIGAARFFFKYCSTFDSTPQGNIGPVAVAMLNALHASQTIFCPAFPRSGRTVYNGHLFVHGKLLSESGMENHPLNPMTDPNLVRWLGRQTDHEVGLLSHEDLDRNHIEKRLTELQETPLVIIDACNDSHLQLLANGTTDLRLLTGGSGIAKFLPDAYRSAGLLETSGFEPVLPAVTGRALVLSGSCSPATNQQVAYMKPQCPAFGIDVSAVMADRAKHFEELKSWAKGGDADLPLLIYSTANPEAVNDLQAEHGGETVAKAIEDFFAEVASDLVPSLGITKLVVAGGETSGAVVNKLGIHTLQIGPEICAGVPWTEAQHNGAAFALALKSGNFGTEDFFERALGMLS